MVNNNFEMLIEHEISQMNEVNVNDGNQEIDALFNVSDAEIQEIENYKKRTIREKAELILNGGEKVITAILPVLDDMERAITNAAYFIIL